MLSRFWFSVGLVLMMGVLGYFIYRYFLYVEATKVSGAPPYGESEADVPDDLDPYAWLQNWQRPEGPVKIGIQVGHWKNTEAPEELKNLRRNGGASGSGKTVAEVNLAIAIHLVKLLEDRGYRVELLPTTVPSRFWADVFLSIHADGSTDPGTSGFKIARPWRDFTTRGDKLVSILEDQYQRATKLPLDPNISRNMRGYYAFSWWRYEHAIHPMTTAVIVETGFLTNAGDRKIIVDQPELVAQALATGIVIYVQRVGLG